MARQIPALRLPKRFARASASFFAATVLLAQVKAPTCSLHLSVVGPFGEKVTKAEIVLTREGSGTQPIKIAVPGTETYAVPWGTYELQAIDGSLWAKQRIIVNANELWLRIGLNYTPGDAGQRGGMTIRGDVTPLPPKGVERWVRVDGVYLNARQECLLDAEGRYSINGLEMGTYLVEVLDGSTVQNVETIEIDPKNPIVTLNIQLKPTIGQ